MTYVDNTLFVGGHYLGKPADFTDRIIGKRIALVKEIPDFCGKNYTLADVGCGNGASMFLLADQMKSCTGYELFPTHQQAFEQEKQKRQAQNCHFTVCNIEQQTPTEQFDRLICFEVIEHLEQDSNAKVLCQMLKSGGKAAISVPNKWWIFETHGAKLPLLPWNRVPFFSWLPTPLHERFANARIYTKDRIANVLQKAGFVVEQMHYITAPLDVLGEGKLKDWLLRNVFTGNTTQVPMLSTSIFVQVRKP